jgi:hypothetical protein
MAGVPSATLEGWAVSMAGTPWDHTYVVSSCGLRWPCWGRSAGGGTVSSGTGSSIIADCLSQPNSEAGLRYGVTGVCHQTANRILHPAGQITVASCRGYGLSTFTYGVYGLGGWPQLVTCYRGGTMPKSSASRRKRSTRGKAVPGAGAYHRAVSAAHAASASEEARRLAELAALVEMALGEPLDRSTFDALAAIQAGLWRTRTDLSASLEAGAMTSQTYWARLNSALQSAMDQSRSLLGEKRFQAIFGDAGRHPEGLVHRETFLAQSGSRQPR